jgi:hypothetical protein
MSKLKKKNKEVVWSGVGFSGTGRTSGCGNEPLSLIDFW